MFADELAAARAQVSSLTELTSAAEQLRGISVHSSCRLTATHGRYSTAILGLQTSWQQRVRRCPA
jgi:hypothetical protein